MTSTKLCEDSYNNYKLHMLIFSQRKKFRSSNTKEIRMLTKNNVNNSHVSFATG